MKYFGIKYVDDRAKSADVDKAVREESDGPG